MMENLAPKVKIGVPRWENLTSEQQSFTSAFYDRLEQNEGLRLIQGFSTKNMRERFEGIKLCQGVVVLGFATWSAERLSPRKRGQRAVFVSDFVQIYTTLALALDCPLLVLAEKSISLRGVLQPHFVPKPLRLPRSLDVKRLDDGEVGFHFKGWLERVKSQKHVFLGYSSSAVSVAQKLRLYLQRIGVSVLDWQTDFHLADAIYKQVQEAAAKTRCAIFLLTREARTTDRGLHAPTDNLIFEIGYFAAIKGKENTLIILEDGVTVPDHLRGHIFIPMCSREQTKPVQDELRKCLAKVLG